MSNGKYKSKAANVYLYQYLKQMMEEMMKGINFGD